MAANGRLTGVIWERPSLHILCGISSGLAITESGDHTHLSGAHVARSLQTAGVGLCTDVSQTAIALFAGWVFGAIALAAVPERSVDWKLTTIAALFLAFCAEGAFLAWYFQQLP
jgi:hypothetical protein